MVNPFALTSPRRRAIVFCGMKSLLFALFLATLLSVPVFGTETVPASSPSEPESLPSWVLLGLGERSAEQKLYGDAVVYFRRAVDRRGIYPEAEARLAAIAGLNGNPALQESLLEKALDEAGLLQVPEDRYALLYALADLRLRQERPGTRLKGELALDTWREILLDDPDFLAAEETGGLEGYYRALFAVASPIVLKTATGPGLAESFFGLNRVLYLYRHPLGFSLRAHQQITAVSLENKAYRASAAQALFALTGIFSNVLEQVRVFHPDYVFRDLKELFVDVNSPVFLGKPAGETEATVQPGGPNPGWLVRYQPIWDYLREAGTRQTLETLARAVEGLTNAEKSSEREAGTRSGAEVAAEVRQWQKILFPQGGR